MIRTLCIYVYISPVHPTSSQCHGRLSNVRWRRDLSVEHGLKSSSAAGEAGKNLLRDSLRVAAQRDAHFGAVHPRVGADPLLLPLVQERLPTHHPLRNLDPHRPGLELEQLLAEHHHHRRRVVQIHAVQTVRFDMICSVELADGFGVFAESALARAEFLKLLPGEDALGRDVEPDNVDREPGPKHQVRRLRIGKDVRLGRGVDIPVACKGTPEDDHLF
mmetsp:Transcript_16998/g.55607  ORF Transcript_16998/g.55607 Transcript_16998/m.55607 type:complete len:218 (-) Transcript_16998:532-1185(-)